MIINCQIEIDWLGDDGRVDQEVKRQMIKIISDKLADTSMEEITKEVGNELHAKINLKIDELMANFLSKPVTITDNYGDTKETFADVSEMLKSRFDNFLDAKVDNKGNPVNACAYGDKFTRLEYFIQKEASAKANAAITQITKDLTIKLDEMVNAKMKDKLSSALLEKIDLAKLI